ncbi:MAG: general secretion pathway protein GspG [Bacteroidia bacterium]|nr:general secretion pathway protein GspG [Bacteroidia bacterium]
MKRIVKYKVKAMTIGEIVVVIGVMGILAYFAIPELMTVVTKAKSTEAKFQLEHVHTLEKSYFYLNSKYSADLNEIDFEHSKLVTDGGNANYRIEIVEASNSTFIARATAITDFDADGVMNVWEIDQDKNIKEITKD